MTQLRNRCIQIATAVVSVVAGIALGTHWAPTEASVSRKFIVRGVLPAEFERQDAMLLGWDDQGQPAEHEVLAQIAREIHQQLEVLVLVRNDAGRLQASEWLQKLNVPPGTVNIIQIPFKSSWIRDYGPTVVKCFNGTFQWIDAEYRSYTPRPLDDLMPLSLGSLLDVKVEQAPLVFHGGNLITNGAGLGIISKVMLKENEVFRDYSPDQVIEILKNYFGLTDVIVLKPLFQEPTGHVDVFVTCTAADTIVVGEFSRDMDPINAAILDQNAKRLARVETPCGLLKVVRIPMPPRGRNTWGGSYTNVVFANGVLLVPSYGELDLEAGSRALAIYRQLLPGWKVVPIDSTAISMNHGGLHCLTRNLFRASAVD